jgi:thioredoxin-like negative regulator of GroEL
MAGWFGFIVLSQALLAGEPSAYERAFGKSQASGQPLLVLVGAQWCPACHQMKHSVLPRMATGGRLTTVSFAAVDSDHEPELAARLMRGPSVPQLIVFSRRPDGRWRREQITGAASEQEVESLIARAIQTQSGELAQR